MLIFLAVGLLCAALAFGGRCLVKRFDARWDMHRATWKDALWGAVGGFIWLICSVFIVLMMVTLLMPIMNQVPTAAPASADKSIYTPV